MLIELEEPFRSMYRKGYLREQEDGRKYVSLYNAPGDQRSITYARYLYSVKLGYEVPEEIEIDHWDNNKTNDDIDNLHPVTKAMHIAKTVALDRDAEEAVNLVCPACQNPFWRTARYLRDKRSQGQTNFYCSRSCSGKVSSLGQSKISAETIARIKRLRQEQKSSYFIAEEVGVARNTVMKHW